MLKFAFFLVPPKEIMLEPDPMLKYSSFVVPPKEITPEPGSAAEMHFTCSSIERDDA
jgi:hypothetical protein